MRDGIRRESGSFRDPDGFIFYKNNEVYRQINAAGKERFESFISSGLYGVLAEKKLIISFEDVSGQIEGTDSAYKVIKPEKIPFISYPYEWSFSAYKDAALLTLEIQKTALEKGMRLRDASVYNIQFKGGKPLFIDTLSFEKYRENEPWAAYGQFCRHFLAPLLLMAKVDERLRMLMMDFIDGIPLDLASKLLPRGTYMNIGIVTNIHMHAASQKKHASSDSGKMHSKPKVTKFGLLGIIDSLESVIKKLKPPLQKTEWGGYYGDTNYTDAAFEEKKKIVSRFADKIREDVNTAWDLGGNTGVFSRICSGKGIYTVCFDIDPAAVEENYRQAVKTGEENILPLTTDLSAPAPAIGWENKERKSMTERGPADLVMALALIHHLAISNNVPLIKTAEFLSNTGRYLIIEFVPKEDSQVQRLLVTREDIFPDYTREGFEKSFGEYYDILESTPIAGTHRVVYLMKKKEETCG